MTPQRLDGGRGCGVVSARPALTLLLAAACVRSPAAVRGPAGAADAPGGGESAVRFAPLRTAPARASGVRIQDAVPITDAPAADRVPPPPAGAALDLEVENALLPDVLRLISEVAGLNFIVDGTINIRVTASLRDVPWNYALMAILDAHGLVAVPLAPGTTLSIVPRRSNPAQHPGASLPPARLPP